MPNLGRVINQYRSLLPSDLQQLLESVQIINLSGIYFGASMQHNNNDTDYFIFQVDGWSSRITFLLPRLTPFPH